MEKRPAGPAAGIELEEVLALSENGEVTSGQTLVGGAKVIALVHRPSRDKKIRVFKYKRKTRYRKMRGHRQPYTRLQIAEIVREES